MRGAGHRRGVTLLELVIAVAIAAAMVSLSLPAFTTGIDNMRLSQAADQVAAFLNGALNRVERREQAVELLISPRENRLAIRSVDLSFTRNLDLPQGVRVDAVLPALPQDPGGPRRFFLLPGGTAPRIGVQLANQRGQRRIVRLDPITGVPGVERPAGE